MYLSGVRLGASELLKTLFSSFIPVVHPSSAWEAPDSPQDGSRAGGPLGGVPGTETTDGSEKDPKFFGNDKPFFCTGVGIEKTPPSQG